MKILITGAAGFVGQRLMAHLLALDALTVVGEDGRTRPRPITGIVAVDRAEGELRDPRVRSVVADVSHPDALEGCLDAETHVVFHLAAVVSGSAEADLELGMRVNLDGMRHLLARCARLGHRPHLVFSSSIAVFGVGMPALVTDATQPMPLLSYGAQKLCAETLVADYTRRGLVRGCSLRLPAVIVRPGSPNGAATGFSSSILREPLAGRECVLPVPLNTRMWCASPGVVVRNLVHALTLGPQDWAPWPSLNLPGRGVSMAQWVEALDRLAGIGHRVRVEPDPVITAMSRTWACEFETPRALALGFERDESPEAMLRAYLAERPADLAPELRERLRAG